MRKRAATARRQLNWHLDRATMAMVSEAIGLTIPDVSMIPGVSAQSTHR
jgi:hypothetical protein